MTLTHDRLLLDAGAHAESHGAWIQLRNFPACEVWVSDDEVRAALHASRGQGYGDPERTRHNIAIGKRCGSYPRKSGEIRPCEGAGI